MTFVLDASAALSWCFDEAESQRTKPVLAAMESMTAIVPAIWQLEVANGLASGERRGRADDERIKTFLDMLRTLPIEVDLESAHQAMTLVLPLARRLQLTSYDASYLDLATRLGAPLATLDRRLEAAARSLGVPLLLNLPQGGPT